jgi:hypothetical protein
VGIFSGSVSVWPASGWEDNFDRAILWALCQQGLRVCGLGLSGGLVLGVVL